MDALLAFPFDDPGWPGKLMLGGLFLLLGPLLLPLILVLGYLAAVAHSAAVEGAPLPAWRPWRQRLRDGGRLLLAMLVWGWPALLLFSTVVVGMLVVPPGPLAGSRLAGTLVDIAWLVQPVGLVWALLAFLLLPLQLRLSAGADSWRDIASPAQLWRALRANLWGLPVAWLKELALFLLSFVGLFLAGIGLAFTSFWCLLGLARLASELK